MAEETAASLACHCKEVENSVILGVSLLGLYNIPLNNNTAPRDKLICKAGQYNVIVCTCRFVHLC